MMAAQQEVRMRLNAGPLMDQRRIFHSRSVDEAYAFLRSKDFQLEEIERPRAHDFDFRINGVYFPGMWLGYIQYGSPVAVRAVERDDYWIQLPICGQLEAVVAGEPVACDGRRAALASPTCDDFYLVRSSRGCRGIRVSLNKASLLVQLAALLGEEPHAPLEFAPALDVTGGYGRSLAQVVLMAVASLDEPDSALVEPVTMRAFEQFVMTALLLSHPHSSSQALRRLDKPIAPRDVRRAIDHIEAHLDQVVTVANLVEAAGVPGRTLFMHFKKFHGVSPMRYLREARMRKARQALLRADPHDNVTNIALSAGFTHMGRFSVAYRRQFGESPSGTLRARKRARSSTACP
jgi:AraC-like DNA-binding protein